MMTATAKDQTQRRRLRATVSGMAAAMMLAGAMPAAAQDANAAAQDARIRQLEAQVQMLQRQTPGATAAAPLGTPASSPMTDMLTRMDAVEAQVARLTAQVEDINNHLRQIDSRPAAAAAPVAGPPAAILPGPQQAAAQPAMSQPATSQPPMSQPPMSQPPGASPTVPPATTAPTSARLAAVSAITKPRSADAAEDDYSYGYKLWQAHFYPEAEQQLQFFLSKYPGSSRVTYARNLIGRAYLDDGQPTQAAQWFVDNYRANPQGDRAADSLIFLAEAMVRLHDTGRACIALGQFADNFKVEAAGRLRSEYDKTRAAVTCG